MRSRVVASVVIAGVIALALPLASEARGDSRPGGGRSSGGHAGSGGVSGRGAPGRDGARLPGGAPHRGRDRHADRGGGHQSLGWGVDLTFPLWWSAYWWWGWPYGGYGYVPYDVYEDPGAVVPPAADQPGATPGNSGAAASAAGTSAVALQVSPPSASVYLNGVLVGTVDEFARAPGVIFLDAGEYALEFRAAGFRAGALTLAVSGGEPTVVALDLEADPTAGAESPAPPPPGLPYGRRFGPSFGPPSLQPVAPAGAGASTRAAATAPDAGALVLRVSPPEAAVYVDGTFRGTGEEVSQLRRGLAVAPGMHRIEVVAPGRAGKMLQVDAKAGRQVEVSVSLE